MNPGVAELGEVADKMLARVPVLRRLAWGWWIHFQDGAFM